MRRIADQRAGAAAYDVAIQAGHLQSILLGVAADMSNRRPAVDATALQAACVRLIWLVAEHAALEALRVELDQ